MLRGGNHYKGAWILHWRGNSNYCLRLTSNTEWSR